jgi:hypothetical protein
MILIDVECRCETCEVRIVVKFAVPPIEGE